MEGAGGLQRNVRADLGDLKQLSLALLVLLGLGELQSQIAVALGKSAGGVDADDDGVPEVDLILLLLAVDDGLVNLLLALGLVVVQAAGAGG